MECTQENLLPRTSLPLDWLVWAVTVVCRIEGGRAQLEGPVVPEAGEDGNLQREEREQQDSDATVLTGTQTD